FAPLAIPHIAQQLGLDNLGIGTHKSIALASPPPLPLRVRKSHAHTLHRYVAGTSLPRVSFFRDKFRNTRPSPASELASTFPPPCRARWGSPAHSPAPLRDRCPKGQEPPPYARAALWMEDHGSCQPPQNHRKGSECGRGAPDPRRRSSRRASQAAGGRSPTDR